MSQLTARQEWLLEMMYAEHALGMAEDDLRDHDGSQLDAPERIAAAKAKIAQLRAAEPARRCRNDAR